MALESLKDVEKVNRFSSCVMDDLDAAKIILEELNENYPCRENAVAITKVDEALMWLEKGIKERGSRGVEGTNQA